MWCAEVRPTWLEVYGKTAVPPLPTFSPSIRIEINSSVLAANLVSKWGNYAFVLMLANPSKLDYLK